MFITRGSLTCIPPTYLSPTSISPSYLIHIPLLFSSSMPLSISSVQTSKWQIQLLGAFSTDLVSRFGTGFWIPWKTAGDVYISGSSISQETVTGGAKECIEKCLGRHSCRSFDIQKSGNTCNLKMMRPGDPGVTAWSSPDWWVMRRPDWYLSEFLLLPQPKWLADTAWVSTNYVHWKVCTLKR